jgi:Protein of unknown function (DUF1759)
MEVEGDDVSVPAYPEEQLANPDFCTGKRKDSSDNVALVGMKILLHTETHGKRSVLRTHLSYLKEAYDTATYWHKKVMLLQPNSEENVKKGKKWKKQLDRKYDRYVEVANVYLAATKRKRQDSVPENDLPIRQPVNPVVIPTLETMEQVQDIQDNHQSSVAPTNPSVANLQRCSTDQRTPLLSHSSPDSWISSLSSQNQMYASTARSPCAQPSAQLPQIKLPMFSGDPKTWLNFAASFHTLIHQHSSDNAYRLAMLRDSLSPIVQNCLGSLLMNPSLYEQALAKLKHIYGNPLLIAKAHLSELKGLPSIPRNNPEALQLFVAQVSYLVSGISNHNFRHELQSSMLLTELASKVPSRLQVKWAIKVSSLRDQQVIPSVEHFLECMEEAADFERTLSDCTSIDNVVLPPHEATSAKKPRIDNAHSKEKQPNKKSNQKQIKPATTYSFAVDTKASQCMFCDQKHESASCKNYSSLSLDAIAERVRKRKACYRCLQSTHLGRNCQKREPCNVNGCKSLHHPIIHGCGRIWKEATNGNEASEKHAEHHSEKKPTEEMATS